MNTMAQKPVTISFRSLASLYDPDDPWPEDRRGLSETAEEQIAIRVEGRLTGLHARHLAPVEIEVPASDLTDERKELVPLAIKTHFMSRADDFVLEKQRTIRIGLRELRLTIAICIPSFLGIALSSRLEHDPLALVIQNILVIFCWVVIWQPFQSLVFDRWTLSTKARVYRLIATMDIRMTGRDGY